MKILFGVQATGNGHITRARALNKWFSEYDIEADFLFSGRPKDQLWDMDEFGNWRCCRGLTFVHEAGELKLAKTIKNNSLRELYRDIHSLDLSKYDLIVTDFEPVTAWAAKRQKRLCVGIGHQYAFYHDIPRRGADFAASTIMRNFAPVDVGLGLHWHHFGGPILPPIAEIHKTEEPSDPNKVVVYLGFEEPDQVIQLLEPFENYLFTYYAPFSKYESRGHIQLKPLSREGFHNDLATAGGVICNAGFELSSEAIQFGKKLLLKPLLGQMEQLSNAEAINLLGLGMSMDTLDTNVLETWLTQSEGKQILYPNVAEAIVKWISEGDWLNQEKLHSMIVGLWRETVAKDVPSFEKAPIPTIL